MGEVAFDTYVHLNHGRWIFDCPNCPQAYSVQSDFPEECENCGTKFNLIVPSDVMANQVTEIVSVRPVENQNWYPDETIQDLLAENQAHGMDNA